LIFLVSRARVRGGLKKFQHDTENSGLLDVIVGAAGVRHPTLAKLDTTVAVEYIPLNASEIAKLRPNSLRRWCRWARIRR
jgi:TRAP-type uncharacterized transport system substrate-binding protein